MSVARIPGVLEREGVANLCINYESWLLLSQEQVIKNVNPQTLEPLIFWGNKIQRFLNAQHQTDQELSERFYHIMII